GVRDGGTEREAVRVLGDLGQLVNAGNVDEKRRLRQPQVEHRSERLAAREQLGLRRLGDQRQRLGQARRPDVVEAAGFHGAVLAPVLRARATASAMRRGVTGEINSSAPSGASASLMALVMAAGGAIAPPSPKPFWPKRV